MSVRLGYRDKIARVDLSTGTVNQISTGEYAQSFIGGRGMATKIYWDEVRPEVQAFDPENRLIFATGPCAGFPGLASARWVVCGKSPGTTPHFFSHSNLGGNWGTELKFAGFDGLVVQGRAEKPVYLLIEDEKISIKDASSIWGKGAVQVQKILKGEMVSSIKVVATGPGGDNMTTLATLLADNDSSGSGGLGGVMGSKKLKAIAVRGSGSVSAAHPERLQELLDHVKSLKKPPPKPTPLTVRGLRKRPAMVATRNATVSSTKPRTGAKANLCARAALSTKSGPATTMANQTMSRSTPPGSATTMGWTPSPWQA